LKKTLEKSLYGNKATYIRKIRYEKIYLSIHHITISILRFSACNGSVEQRWVMDISTNNQYQIKTSNSVDKCMTLSGHTGTGVHIRNFSSLQQCDTKIFNGSKFDVYNNNFTLDVGDCSAAASIFTIDSPIVILEKLVPIIILD